jgi:hypothetical protein
MDPIDSSKLIEQSDDQLINVAELATLLRTTPAQVYKQASTSPQALPPRMTGFGRRLIWRLGTCREWIRVRSPVVAPPSATPSHPRIGRPRQS